MSNEGKTVTIHYIGTLDDGEKFDSSYDHGQPIKFECMAGNVIRGFDEGVRDMEVGEKKTIHIEPEDGYGVYRDDLIQQIPLNTIPNGKNLPVGEVVYMYGTDGSPRPTKVLAIENDMVTLDFNHPLAGKALNFDIELIEIADKG